MAQVLADKGQLCLLRVYVLDAADLLNGLGLKNITTDTIDRIRRIYHDTAVEHTFGQLFDEPGLWIVGMNMEEHEMIESGEPGMSFILPI